MSMITLKCSKKSLSNLYIGEVYLKNYLASKKKCGSPFCYFSLVETLYRCSVTCTLWYCLLCKLKVEMGRLIQGDKNSFLNHFENIYINKGFNS